MIITFFLSVKSLSVTNFVNIFHLKIKSRMKNIMNSKNEYAPTFKGLEYFLLKLNPVRKNSISMTRRVNKAINKMNFPGILAIRGYRLIIIPNKRKKTSPNFFLGNACFLSDFSNKGLL